MNPFHALQALLGHGAPQGQAPGHPLAAALARAIQPAQHQLQVATPARGYNQQPLQAKRAYNSGPMQAGVNRPMVGGMPALGVSFHTVQGGIHNPGFTPMQNSGFGSGTNPQIQAFQDQPGQLNAPRYNPQDQQDGYVY